MLRSTRAKEPEAKTRRTTRHSASLTAVPASFPSSSAPPPKRRSRLADLRSSRPSTDPAEAGPSSSASSSACLSPARAPVLLDDDAFTSASDFLSLVFEFLPMAQVLRNSAVCSSWRRCAQEKLDEWRLLETEGHAVRGLKGSSTGKFRGPAAMTPLPSGGLAIVDFSNRRVQLLADSATTPLTSLTSAGLPSTAIRSQDVQLVLNQEQIAGPTGIAYDPRGSLFVADKQNHCIFRLACGGGSKLGEVGKVLGKVGNHGREKDELWDPEGLAMDEDGLIYVADSGNHRVVVYSVNDKGEFVRKAILGQMGFGDGQLSSPFGVAVARRSAGGLVYVADTLNNRIVVYQRSGEHVHTFGGECLGTMGKQCHAPGYFNLPRNLTVVADHLIVVEDTRLQVLTLQGEPRQVVPFGTAADGLLAPMK